MTVATSGRRMPEQLAAEQFSGLRQRLRHSAGQVLGIERMLEADRDCGEVLVQLAVAQGARLGAGTTDRGGAAEDLTRLVRLLPGAAAPTERHDRSAHRSTGADLSTAVGTTVSNLSGHDGD